jgi:hypothetical protein
VDFFKVKKMMKKDFSSIMKVSVLVLLVMLLCYVPGCKKSTPEDGDGSSAQQSVSEHPSDSEHPSTSEHPSDSEHPSVATKETTTVKSTAPAGMVPIDIKLPKPMFVGTPQSTNVPNLEKPLGKPRPPFLAPAGITNVALGKPVASSDEEPIIGDIEMITDGDMEAADGSYVELGPFAQNVTVDLEALHEIYAIIVWHYHKQARVYFDVVVQVADDPDFITNVRTIFNNDIDNSAGIGVGKDMHYTETNEGKLIDTKGVKARYVRFYSNGNTGNDLNHYIEVAVFGKPVQ